MSRNINVYIVKIVGIIFNHNVTRPIIRISPSNALNSNVCNDRLKYEGAVSESVVHLVLPVIEDQNLN